VHHASVHPALARAVAAALPLPTFAAPERATSRHISPQNPPPAQNEPTPAPPRRRHPLKPIQFTAARLLLLGHTSSVVAQTLRINRYTLTRWKQDPRFRAELDRQLAVHLTLDHDDTPVPPPPQSATLRHKMPHSPAPAQNEPTADLPVYGQ